MGKDQSDEIWAELSEHNFILPELVRHRESISLGQNIISHVLVRDHRTASSAGRRRLAWHAALYTPSTSTSQNPRRLPLLHAVGK